MGFIQKNVSNFGALAGERSKWIGGHEGGGNEVSFVECVSRGI